MSTAPERVAVATIAVADEPDFRGELPVSVRRVSDGRVVERVTLPGFDYNVPMPDWAKPSPRSIQRAESSETVRATGDVSAMATAASPAPIELPLAAAAAPKANGNDYEECLSCQ